VECCLLNWFTTTPRFCNRVMVPSPQAIGICISTLRTSLAIHRDISGSWGTVLSALRVRAMLWKIVSSCRECCRMFSANVRSSDWRCSFAHYAKLCLVWLPAARDNPRIVLLTPGPYNETYFEHAYLAPLLQGIRWSRGGSDGSRQSRVP
jgi:hypothetical protein